MDQSDDFAVSSSALFSAESPAQTLGAAPVQVLYLTEPGDNSAISVDDIHQGGIGDCFLLSSIGELAILDPAAINAMITANANGTETVTLYELTGTGLTKVEESVTNSFLANGVNSTASYSQDIVGDQQEIWVQVLEKAVAQLGGGYASISNGGNPTVAMEELTGEAAQYYSPAAFTAQTLSSDWASGDLITFDTGSGSTTYNLVGDHAYMFDGVVSSGGVSCVQLLNPWGCDEPDLVPVSALSSNFVEIDVGKGPAVVAPNPSPAPTPTPNPAPAPAPTPVIGGLSASQATLDELALRPLAKLTITGVPTTQAETATVTLSAIANGSLSSIGGGSYNATTGVYSVSGTAAAVQTALDDLLFTPTAHQVAPGATVTTGLKVTVGTATATTSVVTSAMADRITLSGVPILDTVNFASGLDPFSSVTISEPDAGQTFTATVTLSGSGTLSGATNGTWTATGSLAAVTAALQKLAYTPAAATLGKITDSTLTLKVTDTAGQTTLAATGLVTAPETLVATGATLSVTGASRIATLIDDGTVAVAAGASLDVTSAVDPTSTGQFTLASKSTLEIASLQGSAPTIKFAGAGELILDTPPAPTIKASTIAGFAAGDLLDLRGIALAGTSLNYAGGILDVIRANSTVSALNFQTTTLGAGTFHIATDNTGGILISHS